MSDNATMSQDTTTEQIKELVVIDTTDTDFAPSPTKKSTPRFIKILYGVLGVIVALICVLFSAAWAYSQCISPVVCEVGSTPDYSALENNIILSAFAKADCEIDKIDCSKAGKTSVPIKFLGKFSLYSPLEFVDTTPPTTKGFEITVSQNLSLSAEMFLPMFFDHSEISVEIIKNDYVLNSVGEYNITFKVTDEYGNSSQFDCKINSVETSEELNFGHGKTLHDVKAKLSELYPNVHSFDYTQEVEKGEFQIVGHSTDHIYILEIAIGDLLPPEITGVTNLLHIIGEEGPQFLSGVSAYDEVWGAVDVSVDTSSVDLWTPNTYTIVYTATDNSGNTTTQHAKITVKHPTRVQLENVFNILQNPYLPNGCEVVSLAIALDYYGYYIDPVELYMIYMPQSPLKEGNPWTSYIGDAMGAGYGCYAPCVVTTGNNYLEELGVDKRVHDVSGLSMKDYENYLDNSTPVIFWGLLDMNCDGKVVWETEVDGKHTVWHSYSHCLVMIGYTDRTYIFCDPRKEEIVEYSKESVEKSFEINYKQACVIK